MSISPEKLESLKLVLPDVISHINRSRKQLDSDHTTSSRTVDFVERNFYYRDLLAEINRNEQVTEAEFKDILQHLLKDNKEYIFPGTLLRTILLLDDNFSALFDVGYIERNSSDMNEETLRNIANYLAESLEDNGTHNNAEVVNQTNCWYGLFSFLGGIFRGWELYFNVHRVEPMQEVAAAVDDQVYTFDNTQQSFNH